MGVLIRALIRLA